MNPHPKVLQRWWSCLTALALMMCVSLAEAKPIKVLFIGNSYTYFNRLPELISWQASVSGVSNAVEVKSITDGGVTLEFHWNRGDALAAIAEQPWDYVVLQEQSTLPIENPAAMFAAVRLFDQKIKLAKAKTILYLTWARAYAPQTQAALDRAYDGIAREIGARVAPVGPAWALARKANPKIQLYLPDQSHPTLAGTYLTAYVFHHVLFGRPPSPSSSPPGLTDDEVAVLQRAAAQAVQAR